MPTTWTTTVWRHFHAGALTRAHRDTLLTLSTYRGTGGLCIPSHATIAERAKVGERTVLRALHQARELGLVSWCERRVRRGWRWLRTSNAYRLVVPQGDVKAGLRARPATSRQRGGGDESQSNQAAREGNKAALAEMLADAAALPDLLARRRAAFGAKKVLAGC